MYILPAYEAIVDFSYSISNSKGLAVIVYVSDGQRT